MEIYKKVIKTWVLVANRASAHFFEIKNGNELSLVEKLVNPRGRLTDRELNSDRPGRVKDRFGRGRHSLMRSHSPKEQIAINFAHEIDRYLEKAHALGKFQKIYLVAPAKLLGELKLDMNPRTKKAIERSFHKDLRSETMEEQLSRLLFGTELKRKAI